MKRGIEKGIEKGVEQERKRVEARDKKIAKFLQSINVSEKDIAAAFAIK